MAWSVAFWASGCGEDGTDLSEVPSDLTLSVSSFSLNVGETLDIVATVLDGNGDQVNTATLDIQWTSSNPSVASVSQAGIVTGIAHGTTTITASLEGLHASVEIVVVQVPTEINYLNAEDLSGSVGDPLDEPVRIQLTDAQGAGVPGIPVFYTVLTGEGTADPSQSVTGSDGTSSTDWTLGPVAGVQKLEVRVVLGGAASSTAARAAAQDMVIIIEAEAEPDPPTAISVTPSPQTMSAGEVGSVSGTVVDQFGNPVSDQGSFTITWSSSDPSVASVTGLGIVTAESAGSATLTGTLEGDPAITGSATVTVVQGSPASIAVVSGDGQVGIPGATLAAPLVVFVGNENGSPVSEVAVEWAVTGGSATLGAGTSETDSAGKATASVTLGATVGSVQITATVQGVGSVSFNATIQASPPIITTTSPVPNGTVGVAYSETLAATGGNGSYTWALINGTALPGGLALNSTTGEISGTPTAAGSTNFEVQVTSAGQTATKALAITILATTPPPPTPPVITTASPLPAGTVGTVYGQTLAATGGDGSYLWALSGGTTLPAGLTLTTVTGVISGTPSAAGTTNFQVQVTSAGQTTTKALAITINAAGPTPPSITTSTLPDAIVGTPYSETLTAVGGDGNYTWALAAGSGIPTGLSISPNGIISGTPTIAAPTGSVVPVTIEVTSAGQTVDRTIIINVYWPLELTATSPMPSGVLAVPYSQTLTATGGSGNYSWALTGGTTLPGGLTLNAATGVISGTPTAVGTANFQVQVTSAGQSEIKALAITINASGTAPPSITTSTLPDAIVGTHYNEVLTATGGDGNYTWALAAGSGIPTGLSISANGVISGTPTIAAPTGSVVPVKIEVTSAGQTADRTIIVRVYWELSITSSATPLSGAVGSAYATTLTATGGDGAYAWALAAGALPAGLSLDGGTGEISGVPTMAGTRTFTVQVTSAGLTNTKNMSLGVLDGSILASLQDVVIRPFSSKASSDTDRGSGTFPQMTGGSEGWDGSEANSANFTIVEDLSAPVSPDSVARIRYLVGLPAGTGPVLSQTQGFTKAVHGALALTELYVQSHLKLGPDYHAAGVHNKLYFFRSSRPAPPRPEPLLALKGNGDGTFNLRVDFQQTPDAGTGPDNGVWEAVGAGHRIEVDRWYDLETYLKLNSAQGVKDGIFRQWVNGELVIERTDVDYRMDPNPLYWDILHISPTFGGTNREANPVRFDFFLDHITVKGR